MKNLINLLDSKNNIDEYVITKVDTSSTELFFIKNELQMNRGKDVSYIHVTVYKNFTENDVNYKGSSTTKLSPSMSMKEIEKKLDTAALAASFVKNEYYDLVDPVSETAPIIESVFNDGEILESISNLVKDLYEEDNQYGAFINSSEFFIDKIERRIINSKGIDVSFTSYKGEIELVTEAMGETEAIELFEILHFSDYDQEAIKETIKEELYYASLRAKSIPMPNVKDLPVILKGTSATELFDYYNYNAAASVIYQNLHQNKVGDNIQGEDVKGDLVNISLVPYIKNSTSSRYYDSDGMLLKDTVIYKDGVIQNLIAGKRFADYIKVKPTGNIQNVVVSAGNTSEKDMKKTPYLEVLKFSAFQTDSMTGNFGGEFRLAIYFDGENEIPVTLGSISANIKEAQKEMYFSKELAHTNNHILPKCIKFNKVLIAGN